MQRKGRVDVLGTSTVTVPYVSVAKMSVNVYTEYFVALRNIVVFCCCLK